MRWLFKILYDQMFCFVVLVILVVVLLLVLFRCLFQSVPLINIAFSPSPPPPLSSLFLRSNNGWYPRTIRTREDLQQQDSPCTQRRGSAKIYSIAQEVDDFLSGEISS